MDFETFSERHLAQCFMNRHEQADQRDEAAAEGRLQTMALALIRGALFGTI
jgi:hypothetical protein